MAAPWQPTMREPDVVWNTDLGAYDQVIALTQYMVNESFRNMWLKVEDQPNHPMRRFQVKTRRDGSIDAQLDSPLVVFNVQTAAFNEVVYVIRFKSGKGNLYKSDDDDDTTEYDLSGFAFAFTVAIGTKVETPGSLSHAELIKQLPKAGGPGDYTVQRLLIDFTTAKLSNPVAELSTFSIKDWKSSYTIRKGLQTLMNAHLEKTKQQETDNVGGGSLLGFVATANNPGLTNAHAPTFVPTFCSFQTYPYFNRKSIGNEVGVGQNGTSGTSRFNYLCYREMTENDKPPTDTNLINLPIRGIWTTDKVDGRGVPVDRGTFMISRKNFWGNYLLPLLKKYNGVMETICGRPDVYVKIDGFGLWWRWSCGWSIGEKPDRNYDWIQDGKTKWYYSSFEGENKDKRARLKDDQIIPYEKKDTSGFIRHSYLTSKTKSWSETELSFEPGSNKFTMKGQSGLHFWLQLDDWKSLVETDELKYICDWQVDFTMGSVKDGGLEIKVNAHTPILREGPNNKFELSSYNKGTLKTARDWAKTYFEQSLKNLTALESSLTNAFKNQNKFFFPGAGAYFFQDPTFNHNGDMFCRISFNADQEAPVRYQPTVTPATLPTNPPTSFEGHREDPSALEESNKPK